jgi:hypothetical protein
MSKFTAKYFKSIGKGIFVDRRTDGRLIFATYWLNVRVDEEIQQDDKTDTDVLKDPFMV